MANTKKLTLAGIAIMIVLLSPGFAQADYGNNSLWETYLPSLTEQVGLIEVFRIRFGQQGS